MAEILSQLCSLSPRLPNSNGISDQDYDNQIHDHLAYLRQAMPSEASDVISSDNSLLDKLDPSLHSLSYVFVWHFQVQSFQDKSNGSFPDDVCPGGKLWSKAVQFLMTFDPIQMRYAGREWRELVEILGQSALSVSKPLLAVQPIRGAILRLDPSCAIFTSTHLLFIKLCLYAKAYTYALPILENPICHFPTGSEQTHLENNQPLLCARNEHSPQPMRGSLGFSAKLTYSEHLEYFLYGAMIYMVLKKWSKAHHFLAIVISSPVVNSVSMIMVEAYKKWILTSLLRNGKLVQTPVAISSHTMKIYRSLARPYITLAEAFESGDLLKLEAEVESAQSIWHMDRNIGLVLQVLGIYEKVKFHRLGKTFAALTVADATEQKGTDSTSISKESFVAALIMSKALNATISHSCDITKPAMLRFLGAVSNYYVSKESYMQTQFIEGGLLLATLMNNVDGGSYILEMSKEHIGSLQRSHKQADSALTSTLAGESGGFDLEEDIMRDMS